MKLRSMACLLAMTMTLAAFTGIAETTPSDLKPVVIEEIAEEQPVSVPTEEATDEAIPTEEPQEAEPEPEAEEAAEAEESALDAEIEAEKETDDEAEIEAPATDTDLPDEDEEEDEEDEEDEQVITKPVKPTTTKKTETTTEDDEDETAETVETTETTMTTKPARKTGSTGGAKRSSGSAKKSGGKTKPTAARRSDSGESQPAAVEPTDWPDAPVYGLTLGGEALDISLDEGKSAFLVSASSGVMSLTPASEAESWSLSSEAAAALEAHGISQLALTLGTQTYTLETAALEDQTASEAPEEAETSLTWQVTEEGVQITTEQKTYLWRVAETV